MTRLPGASSDLPGACEVYSCDNPETADSKNTQSKFRLIQLSAVQVRRAAVAPGINPHQHLFQSSRSHSLSTLNNTLQEMIVIVASCNAFAPTGAATGPDAPATCTGSRCWTGLVVMANWLPLYGSKAISICALPVLSSLP